MSFIISAPRSNSKLYTIEDGDGKPLNAGYFCHISDYDKVACWFNLMFRAIDKLNDPNLSQQWQETVITPLYPTLPNGPKKAKAIEHAENGEFYDFISQAADCYGISDFDAWQTFTTLACKLYRAFLLTHFENTGPVPAWHDDPMS